MIPDIVVNKFISEIYPFSEEELNNYKERVDFKFLSKNKNVRWCYELIKRFEDLWDWNSLEQNQSVFKRVTLGLLFPERVKVRECDCFFQMNFCERFHCIHNIKIFKAATSLNDDFPEVFIRMRMMLESGAIDAAMIKSYYESEDPSEVIKLEMELH